MKDDNNLIFRKEKKLLDDVFELNPYPILICDAEGHHVKANSAWLKMGGLTKILGPEYSIVKDPVVEKEISPVLEGKIVHMPDVRYNMREFHGPQYPDITMFIRSTVFPLLDDFGKLEYILLVYEDITERVKAEDGLKQKIEELEKMNKFMTGRELKMVELKKEIEELKLKCENK